ncbi:MAG TPA: hypothetical protein VE173_05760, partial [Longimicrobiales bacterium]|nr:hypothetical protein [Longimicrobiales bacterium]
MLGSMPRGCRQARRLVYEGYRPEDEPLREALCTLGNGVFATRGAAPESRADGIHYPGTYRIGLYNRQSTTIGGTTVENESLVHLPDWLEVAFRVDDGEWFEPAGAELLEYRQELDLREGILFRRIRFRQDGRTTRLTQRRLVSMAAPHLAALETTWEAEDWSGSLRVRAGLDGWVENGGVERYRRLEGSHLAPVEARAVDDETLFLLVRTLQSAIRIAEAARVRVFRDGEALRPPRDVREEEAYVAHELDLELDEGKEVTVEKVVCLRTSLDHALSESGLEARKGVRRAGTFQALLEAHRLAWHHVWRRARIRIGG